MTNKLFESMDERSRNFYLQVFHSVLLNAAAVKYGYFDVLLCETEDPRVMLRWQDTMPKVIEQLQKLDKKG